MRMPGVPACVRLNPHDSGEVVWGTRLDPARIRIRNVPLPASKRRFGDILLNDGAAEGTRESNGEEYPVFNELAVWYASPHNTFESALVLPDAGSVDRLVDLCSEIDIGIENRATIRILCEECSRGSPGPHKCTAELNKDGKQRYGFGAVDRDILLQVLTAWVSEDRGRRFTDRTLEVASDPDA